MLLGVPMHPASYIAYSSAGYPSHCTSCIPTTHSQCETQPPYIHTQERPDAAYGLLAVDFLPPDVLGTYLRGIAAQMAAGALQPLRSACYSLSAAATAMRALAQASHVGKVGSGVCLCACV